MGVERTVIAVSIANGATVSSEFNVNGRRLVGVMMPAVWTAGNLTIQALIRQPTGNPPAPAFANVVDGAGAPIVLAATPTADTYLPFADTNPLLGLGRARLQCGVAQAAQRDFFVVVVDT